MAKKSAADLLEHPRHAHWDKVVSAAYLRMTGSTQEQAAVAVGRNERTIREWESDTVLWEAARSEARFRWLNDAEDAARAAVLGSLRMGNADLGKWVLERVDDALAPPKQRAELTGKDGGPIEVATDELRDRLAGRVAGIAARIGTGGNPGGAGPR